MKIEKKLDKINENIQTTRCDLEDLLNEFQDFILAKKDDIKSVAASALTQASGEDVEDEGDSGSDTRNAGKKTI
jgi:hypothetical protein